MSQISLTSYDTVVAVTQGAINESLAQFLYQLNKSVELYFTVDSQGNFVPSTPESAVFTFTGTLDYTVDAKNNPVNMVVLNSGKGSQTVLYNITFANARFVSKAFPPFDVSQVPGAPWIIAFAVDLKNAEVALASLPADLSKKVQDVTQELGPNMFSIQQLYLDLNTAEFDSFQNITGMSSYAGTVLTGIMQCYLQSLQASGGIIFGYSILSLQPPSLAPTFTPTALDFCVSPYRDANGNNSEPSLDTLVYLLMTEHRPLPPAQPVFDFNFVADTSQPLQGVMAVRSGLYVPFLINQLNPLLKTLSPVAYVKANGGNVDAQNLQLNAGTDQVFTIVNPAQGGVIAQYTYSSQAKDEAHGFSDYWMTDVKLYYSSTCQVQAAGPIITISGSSTVSATINCWVDGSPGPFEMAPTTYKWSVELVQEMDPTLGGQLNFKIQNFQKTAPPDPPKSRPWYDLIDPGKIIETLDTQVLQNIQTALKSGIQTAGLFVVPGAATFVFQNPSLSATDDLVVDLTYS